MAAATATSPAVSSDLPLASVRMYRQGLGDCFLVTFRREDGSPYRVMIDCGVVLGTEEPERKMRAVVQSIIETSGGVVDLLVVTHEHWDHVSGFTQVDELFAGTDASPAKDKLVVREVWMGWTEDPGDEVGQQLRHDRQARLDKLAGFVAGADALGLAQDQVVAGIGELLSFFGVDEKGQRAGSTGAALDKARGLAGRSPRYCRPDDAPASLPGVPGLRVYVLGPPRDPALIRKTDADDQVYHLAAAGEVAAFFAAPALGAAAVPATAGEADHQPFDAVCRHRLADLRDGGLRATELGRFFDRHYFGMALEPAAPDQDWRRIDTDWLGDAAEFALQLDNATNNTSLVLAFELVASGKVLLFVGDAQAGNWLSWGDLAWKRDDGTTVAAPDLLKRAVFYKVGHHGSHNATLRQKGLELMGGGAELVAFIPVDHEMAVKKRWGKMPLPGLVTALQEKTAHRLVRVDTGVDANAPPGFVKELIVDELFIEWQLAG